ncbi:hypothetical protein C4D60_Mb10t24810 [Musa balbisiana]|uniref:RHOMBOID-like protein n=1 Tax=Musa balbisiana TaxID=52838 RepID=A0A4S8IZM5_MUSBA|nr:hypothetical protein C4D60_Mb10t24810 [Musa balbisiana]
MARDVSQEDMEELLEDKLEFGKDGMNNALKARIGLLYIMSGFGGSLLSSLFTASSISVGASGALFGLLGGMLSELLTNWTIYANKFAALLTLIFIIVINLAVGLLPDVDNFAHIGGFVSGFLLGFMLLIRPQFGWSSQEGSNVNLSCEGSSRTHSYFLPDATEARLRELCSQLCG